jgi:hypothetical protein
MLLKRAEHPSSKGELKIFFFLISDGSTGNNRSYIARIKREKRKEENETREKNI